MSKAAKSSRRNKRAGSARPQSARRPRAGAAGPASRRGDEESKRRLWERKQAELEARWVAAQAKQSSEEAARRRTMKIARRVTGIGALAVLLCVLALYYTYGGTGAAGLS